MTTFHVNVVKSGRAAVEQVRGELDLSTTPRVRDELASLADDGPPGPSTRKVLEITGLTSAFRLESIACPGIHRRICGVGQKAPRRMTGDRPYVTVD